MSYHCAECKDDAQGREMDDGIGPYEHFGAKGHHREMVVISECCEAPLLYDNGVVVDYCEWKADEDACYGDYLREQARDREMERSF